jgi:hypothetical protein
MRFLIWLTRIGAAWFRTADASGLIATGSTPFPAQGKAYLGWFFVRFVPGGESYCGVRV